MYLALRKRQAFKYNWECRKHFITEDQRETVDFGDGQKNIYALEGAQALVREGKRVKLAVHEFRKGRAIYISGLPYSFANNRLLYRSVLWSAHKEDQLHRWYSTNYNEEVHPYVGNGNNTYEPQKTVICRVDGSCFEKKLEASEIIWYEI